MPGRAAKVTITERQQAVLRAMTRSSTCPQALAQRTRIIDYYNRTLAKPFKWTFTGRPLNM
jgi:hypothetical protein